MQPLNCDVYMDLMPLVKDGAASESSRMALEDHMKECARCRSVYASLPEGAPEGGSVKKLRSQLMTVVCGVILVGVLLGIAMTNTTSIVYNSVIFPLVGILAFLMLKKWCWTVPVGILVGSLVLLGTKYMIGDGAGRMEATETAWQWGVCYALTCFVGVGLGAAGYYCFTKPREPGLKARLERIGGALLAVVLCGGLLLVFHMIVGNPFVLERVRLDSQKYVDTKYDDPALRVWGPSYNFLEDSYRVRVEKENSEDVQFYLLYDCLGNFAEDGYEKAVLSGNQTVTRLIREYENAVQEQIAILEDMDYVMAELSVFDKRTGTSAPLAVGIDPGTLEVDGEYDVKTLGATYGYVYINADEENVNFERAAELLNIALDALEKEKVGVYAFRIWLTGEGEEALQVEMVRPEDLRCQDPVARLEELWKQQQE